jgi:hypothetical protein
MLGLPEKTAVPLSLRQAYMVILADRGTGLCAVSTALSSCHNLLSSAAAKAASLLKIRIYSGSRECFAVHPGLAPRCTIISHIPNLDSRHCIGGVVPVRSGLRFAAETWRLGTFNSA